MADRLVPATIAILVVASTISCTKPDATAPSAGSTPAVAAIGTSPTGGGTTTVGTRAIVTTTTGSPAIGTPELGMPKLSLQALGIPGFGAPARDNKEIADEIRGLHDAVLAYKERNLVVPTAMAVTNTNSRNAKFMAHLRSVYPSSAYGVRVMDFDRLNDYLGANYRVKVGDSVVLLDLRRLDQAEALVFWLGGFPTPVKTTGADAGMPVAATRLFGFNKDTDSPLKRSSLALENADPLATRTPSLFAFKPERLVDHDGDGWWEYLPPSPASSTTAPTAPYVYFDYDSYVSVVKPSEFTPYPRPDDPQSEKLRKSFGSAVPLAAYYDPSGRAPMRWQNPASFQIVCGGLDGKYSLPDPPARITVFPSGNTYDGPGFRDPPRTYDPNERDNLTNLAEGTLEQLKAEL